MPEAHTPSPARRWGIRVLILLFYAGLAWVLVSIARELDWAQVRDAVRSLPLPALLLAACCSACCYMLYAGYEILAARHVGLGLRTPVVATIGFVSYACNLSLGAMLGALGVRLRLYGARDVAAADAARVIGFNLLTNWVGYLCVLGLALLVSWSEPPAAWRIGALPLRAVGIVLLGLAVAYVWACARATRRSFTLRGHAFELPTLRFALLQLALSLPAWLAAALALHVLLQGEAGFDRVVISLLFAAVAGLVIRVPAGLGVIEAVFLASLGPELGQARVLAGLLAYRCVHYLGPLLAGLVGLAVLELQARRARGTAAPRSA